MRVFGLSTHAWYLGLLVCNLYVGVDLFAQHAFGAYYAGVPDPPTNARLGFAVSNSDLGNPELRVVSRLNPSAASTGRCDGLSWAAYLPVSIGCACTYTLRDLYRNVLPPRINPIPSDEPFRYDLADEMIWVKGMFGVTYERCKAKIAVEATGEELIEPDTLDTIPTLGIVPNYELWPKCFVTPPKLDGPVIVNGLVSPRWSTGSGFAVRMPLAFAYLAIWSSLFLLDAARRGTWPERGAGRSGSAWVDRAYYVALYVGIGSFAALFLPSYHAQMMESSTAAYLDIEYMDGATPQNCTTEGESPEYSTPWPPAPGGDKLFKAFGEFDTQHLTWSWGLSFFSYFAGESMSLFTFVDGQPLLLSSVWAAPLLLFGGAAGVILMRAAGGFQNKRGCCGLGCCTCECCNDCCAPCCDVRKPEGERLWLHTTTPSITFSVA